MTTDRELARIAERSHGLLSDEQWTAIGLSDDQRHRWTRSGRISVPEPGVIRIGGSVSTWHQRVLAAAMTEDGYASHRTAAALWRLEGFDPRIVEVTTLRWRRRPNASVKVHESKRLTSADVTTRDGIPCTTVEWSLIHLGAVVPAVLVEIALDDALRRGLTTPEALWEVFRRAASKGVNGVGVIRPMLVRRLGTSGARPNGFERRLFHILERAGLPVPEAQVEIRDGSFVAYADWGWRARRVLIECVSDEWHSGRVRRKRDTSRRNRLQLLGFEVLEFTDDHVRREQDEVAKTCWLAYERGGRLLA